MDKGNLVDKKIIDVFIDQENYVYERVRQKLVSGMPNVSSEIKVAMIYWRVNERIAEEASH